MLIMMVNAWVTLLYLLSFWGDNGKLSNINNPSGQKVAQIKHLRTTAHQIKLTLPILIFGVTGVHRQAPLIRKMKLLKHA